MADARIRANSAWMMADQVFRQAVGLGFSIWIARHFGPAGFGNLSFALSLCALFGVASTLGLNRILVREFADPARKDRELDLLGAVIAMRIVAGFLVALLAIVTVGLTAPESVLLVAILVIGFVLTPFEAIDLYYQSRLRSGIVTVARTTAIAASSAVKAWLLVNDASLPMLAFAYVLDWAFSALALIIAFYSTGKRVQLGFGDGILCRRLLGESWPEIIAGIGALVFMRIDQVMLHSMRGATEVGIMAVSSRLTEAWYFIPAAIVSSTFPVVVALGATDPVAAERRQTLLYRRLILLSIVASLCVMALSDTIIRVVYGGSYAAAAQVLIVHTWCGLFMCLGIASGTWLMARKLVRLNLYRTAGGAMLNVVLNLVLIPPYGAVGSAWATLAAFAFAYFFIDFLVPSMREIGRAKLRALDPRWPS